MRSRTFSLVVLVFVLPLLAVSAYADILGAAAPYAAIGGSGVTNAGAGVLGATVIHGSVAALAANSCTGIFLCDGGPGIIIGGTAQVGNSIALAVEGVGGVDTAELALLASGPGTNLTGLTLGVGSANNLAPGVYSFSSTAGLSNTLTLAGGEQLRSGLDLPDRVGAHYRLALSRCRDRYGCSFRGCVLGDWHRGADRRRDSR